MTQGCKQQEMASEPSAGDARRQSIEQSGRAVEEIVERGRRTNIDVEGRMQGGRADASVRIARRRHLGLFVPRTAARTSRKLALVWRDRRETYAELYVAVNRIASALRARELRQGDKMARFPRHYD